MNELEIEVRALPEATVVSLRGDAGMMEAEHLNLALTRVMLTHPAVTIIDLTGLKLLASISMGALVAYHRGIKLKGGVVKLAGATKNVLESLQHARIDLVIEMCPTVEGALSSAC